MSSHFDFMNKLLTDGDFRKEFISNPSQTLESLGINDFKGKEIKVYQNDMTNWHFALLENGSPLDRSTPMGRVFADVQEKVWKDASFMAELLNNTSETLMPYFGPIPGSIRIHFHQNTPELINFVLPASPWDQELSDSDLDQVAGGKGGGGNIFSSVTGAISSGVNAGVNAFNSVDGAFRDISKSFMRDLHGSLHGKGSNFADTGKEVENQVGTLFSGW